MNEIHRHEEPHLLRLDLPAAHSAGRMARQMVRQFALSQGLPGAELDRLEFVAGELLDNAVDHGGGHGAREVSEIAGDVRMSAQLCIHQGSWTFTVGDQGGGDPEELRRLCEPEGGFPDLDDERGRGFFLLAQMVDELTVGTSDDGLGIAVKALRRY